MSVGLCRVTGRLYMCCNHRLVKLIRITLYYSYGVQWASPETCSQAIAQVISREDRLAIYYLDRTFRTGGHTLTAAVTFFRVYGYDFSFHYKLLCPVR
jgi:hypothetical protein